MTNPKVGEYVFDTYYKKKKKVMSISSGANPLYFLGADREPNSRKDFTFPIPGKEKTTAKKGEYTWTSAQKKYAHDILLSKANHYEATPKKKLVGVKYLPNGTARWEGKAHNYTQNHPDNKPLF